MAFPVAIPMQDDSRYSLHGSMARQLADVFASRGCEVNPPGPLDADRPGLMLFLRDIPELHQLAPEITRPGSRIAIAQLFVDHPFALNDRTMDLIAELPNYRLLLPCIDGGHMLRLRWPSLIHAHCPHAIAPEALCPSSSITASDHERPFDLVVTGSIHSEAELDGMRTRLPHAFRPATDEMIGLLDAHPTMPFEQALDIALGTANIPPGQWRLASSLWHYVVASVNRRRRIRFLRAMQGVRTFVYGGAAWKDVCDGTIKYQGSVGYDDIPEILGLAKVSLAWGPTQFTHSFSERLLLSMGAGCATVADDRLMVQRMFPVEPADTSTGLAAATVYPPHQPQLARHAVQRLLADDDMRIDMARRGRAIVEERHLWAHRFDLLSSVGSAAIAA
ncbi:MAG: glycosyltransferase [Planctomycetota bacterium]